MAIPKSRNTSIVKATIAKAPLNEEEAVLKARRARQRVSFDQRKNTLHDNTQWCREECQELWYSAGELNQMKEECYALARKIHQKEKDFQDVPESYKNVILRVYDACCVVPCPNAIPAVTERDTSLLAIIAEKSCSRSGLEKVCIREIAHDKRFRREELYDSVLGIQAHCKVGSQRTRAELTRLASEMVSRAQRHFANIMAVALAASLH